MGLKFWYGLLIRIFISLASSKNDSHMLMKQKCKQIFAYSVFVYSVFVRMCAYSADATFVAL